MKKLIIIAFITFLSWSINAQHHLSLGDAIEIQFLDDKEGKTYYAISNLWEDDRIDCVMSHSGTYYTFQLLKRDEIDRSYEAIVLGSKGGNYTKNSFARIVIYEANPDDLRPMDSKFAVLYFTDLQRVLAECIGTDGENTIYKIMHSGKQFTITPKMVVKKSKGQSA